MIIGVLLGIVCQAFILIFYFFLGGNLWCKFELTYRFGSFDCFIYFILWSACVDVENGIMSGNLFALYRFVVWVLGFYLIQWRV